MHLGAQVHDNNGPGLQMQRFLKAVAGRKLICPPLNAADALLLHEASMRLSGAE